MLSSIKLWKGALAPRLSLAWLIILAAVPSIIDMVLRLSVVVTDTLMVGRMLGTEALAAVGYANIIMFASMAIFSINHGAMAIMGRYYGARNRESFRDVARHSILLNGSFGLIIAIAMYLSAGTIARLYGFEGVGYDMFVSYLHIVSFSMIFMGVMISISFVYRALGDTKTPMVITIVVVLLNGLFNYIFIVGWWVLPEMGVAGVAIATLLSRFIAVLILIYFIAKSYHPELQQLYTGFKFSPSLILQIGRYGSPLALTDLFTHLSSLTVSFLVAPLGTSAMALMPVLATIQGLSTMPSFGFSLVASVFVRHALGENNWERVKDVLYVAMTMIVIWSLGTMLVLIIFREPLIILYTNNVELAVLASLPVLLLGLNQVFTNYLILTRQIVSGAGNTLIVLGVNIVRQWVMVIPLMVIFMFVFDMGLSSVYLADIIAFSLASLFYTVYLLRGGWVREIK